MSKFRPNPPIKRDALKRVPYVKRCMRAYGRLITIFPLYIDSMSKHTQLTLDSAHQLGDGVTPFQLETKHAYSKTIRLLSLQSLQISDDI